MVQQIGANFNNSELPELMNNAEQNYQIVINNSLKSFENAANALATVGKVQAAKYDAQMRELNASAGSGGVTGLGEIGKALVSAYAVQEELAQQKKADEFKERQMQLEENKFKWTQEQQEQQIQSAQQKQYYDLVQAELSNKIVGLEGQFAETIAVEGKDKGVGLAQQQLDSEIYQSEYFRLLPPEYRVKIAAQGNLLITNLRKERATELSQKQKELTTTQLETDIQKFQLTTQPITSRLKNGAGVLDEATFSDLTTQYNDKINEVLSSNPVYANDPLLRAKFYQQAVKDLSDSLGGYYKDVTTMSANQARWLEANSQLEALQVAYDSGQYGWTAADLEKAQKSILLGLGLTNDPNTMPSTRAGAVTAQIEDEKRSREYGELKDRTNNLEKLGINSSQQDLYERSIVGESLFNALNGGGRELTVSRLEYKVKNDPHSPTAYLDGTTLTMLKRYDTDKTKYFELRQQYLTFKQQIEEMNYVPTAQYRDPYYRIFLLKMSHRRPYPL